MKTLLICPAPHPAIARLADDGPLVLAPILGKCLLEYWLDHLVVRGDRDVRIVASDRPDQIRARVGDGARWGLRLEVVREHDASAMPEARGAEPPGVTGPGEPPADPVVILDHLPGLARLPLFESYEGWFKALQAWQPHALTPDRIGRRELKPGVSVGLHAHIAASAQLHAPCWIGDDVVVGPDAMIGPGAVLEDRAFVGAGAHITHSIVGPETLVGEFTLITHSLASGNLLINWKTRSCLNVPDEFLLCSLTTRPARPRTLSRIKAPLATLRNLISERQDDSHPHARPTFNT